ncbi:hypothetical protein [Pseudomonas abietaniphila]|jgi:hypothetical protein|uniref:Uncharacterized protein n=1 Tax=Pseudomonas abietaniphila TaxID=89065 RepID=A0A1G8ULF9_9PSED|nr:hypothetical protein [Pseudomonas abietaniphila]SDJ54726.1 hypothetical protein SAMN05216605_1422 [Pseudomonas abietaniphila]
MKEKTNVLESNLQMIFNEIKCQGQIGASFPPEMLSFDEQMEQMSEWLFDVGELELFYENLILLLDKYDFRISGSAAIRLLEVGLLMRFKTTLDEDLMFNFRPV